MDIKILRKKLDASLTDLPPLGMDVYSLVEDFRRYYSHTLGRDRHCNSAHYAYQALVLSLRERLLERWKNTRYGLEAADSGHAYYLSLEFLMGRALGNAALNLGFDEETELAVNCLGMELEDLTESEQDAGLGNGGLGRLAACFLDSCATLQLPVTGYGLRYEYGMFRQSIEGGEQVEKPDHWLLEGNPWELERPEYTQRVRFEGRSEWTYDSQGRQRPHWVDSHDVLAVPYDVPVPGYRNGTVNTLRLWKACATDEFDLGEFNAGLYPESVSAKNSAEQITLVLYPNDSSESGKELRLRQQYFLASASLQDVVAHWVAIHGDDFTHFAAKNRFQLNDTHPSCAIPELMRLLIDEHGFEWDRAWEITSNTMAYTNHTLLPEALERWPVPIFARLLPRLLEIVYEINTRFLAEVAKYWPGMTERQRNMSIIEDGPVPQVRMAYLAIVGSFSVNGVAALHSRLLTEGLFSDFFALWPKKFNNKTNGVTPRRWLAHCNPKLSELISEKVGKEWVTNLSKLAELKPQVEDPLFRERWRKVKQQNKQRLANMVEAECGVVFDIGALFDIQVKRIHEYKRQLLNVLHVIHLYDRLKRGEVTDWTPRCVLIGGKAAPGYFMAKRIIKLINNLASVINADPATEGYLRLVFLPNYRVTAMEIIAPGTDLSEQISTAGKEASGTGNMKFMMNGALTIGTLDGANVEIREETGEENFFLFGLTADQVDDARSHYDPAAIIAADPDLQRVIQLLKSGQLNPLEPGIFDPILQSLTSPQDPWMTIADFRSYIDTQQRVAEAYRNQEHWTRMSILNTASSGHFSTDRTIAEYNRDIWKLEAVKPVTG